MICTDEVQNVEQRLFIGLGDKSLVSVPGCGFGEVEEEDGPVCGAQMGAIRQHQLSEDTVRVKKKEEEVR